MEGRELEELQGRLEARLEGVRGRMGRAVELVGGEGLAGGFDWSARVGEEEEEDEEGEGDGDEEMEAVPEKGKGKEKEKVEEKHDIIEIGTSIHPSPSSPPPLTPSS